MVGTAERRPAVPVRPYRAAIGRCAGPAGGSGGGRVRGAVGPCGCGVVPGGVPHLFRTYGNEPDPVIRHGVKFLQHPGSLHRALRYYSWTPDCHTSEFGCVRARIPGGSTSLRRPQSRAGRYTSDLRSISAPARSARSARGPHHPRRYAPEPAGRRAARTAARRRCAGAPTPARTRPVARPVVAPHTPAGPRPAWREARARRRREGGASGRTAAAERGAAPPAVERLPPRTDFRPDGRSAYGVRPTRPSEDSGAPLVRSGATGMARPFSVVSPYDSAPERQNVFCDGPMRHRNAKGTPMDRREIADIVRARIGELLDHPRTIEEGDILSHHGLNSLLGVELTLRVEEEFDIAFEDDELNVENFETLRNITDLVAGKVAVRG
ncbi:hypothetical protein D7M15_04335 [Streptomyces sp. Z26]|nr:hypothetical protein D7M15_04335 [Streptomyces sp. Z26]